MKPFFVVLFVAVTASLAANAHEFPAGRCMCNTFNLTSCEGTGPLLRSYLWSDEGGRSQWFDARYAPAMQSREACLAMSYLAVPTYIPVFNYYGNLVRGCAIVWKNCDLQF